MKKISLDKSVFLVNPISGKLSLNKKVNIIKKIIKGTKAEIIISNSIDNALEIASNSMKGKKIVVACGGDGLVNIVAHQAILNDGIIAILPFGRGNDFAKSLSIFSENDLINSFKFPNIINARYIQVNFKDNYRISLTCAGVGLLSEAAYRASRIPILKGVLLYAFATIFSFINLKNHKYKLIFDDQKLNEELLIVAAAASQYTGGGMYIAPEAFKIQKKVNVLYSTKVNHMNAIKLLLSVFNGNHLKHFAVKNLHTKNLSISSHSNNFWANLVYGDGEYLGNLPVRIQLGKKKLRVLVPKIR